MAYLNCLNVQFGAVTLRIKHMEARHCLVREQTSRPPNTKTHAYVNITSPHV